MNPAALASVEQFEEDRARWRKYVAEVEVLHCNSACSPPFSASTR